MKGTLVVVLYLICSSFAASSSLFPLLFGSRSTDDLRNVCGDTFGNKCADCFTMLVCLGPSQAPVATQCSYDKPYCDPVLNVCASERPNYSECEGPIPPSFKCPAHEGFYPHPTDCSKYFECHKGQAYNLECPPKYAWTTAGMGCKPNKKTADCGTIKCKSSDHSVPLSNNPSFYGMCNVPGSIDNILVLKCEGKNKVYVADQGCVFVCPAEGLFVDEDSPAFYYECYKPSSKLVFTRKQCTAGRIFNEKQQLCIESTN
ncbi:uncharacterized protein LOC129796690 [Lutzomyia longipalpis]|uniref:Putative peritrophin-like protein n=1 Tax=Lutzomyia longipalpis TaxID=7200 RepID=A0A1B0GHW7_LUTLO|nr:uncharacterized protein LOC129796690 [Lutzomyia longipalpis]